MADYKTWMLTGYRQSHTNGREGLQYFDMRGLSNHRYFSDWHNTGMKDWNNVLQSDHGAWDNSNARYHCYSEGVFFQTATLMFTNPNTKDFHLHLYKNGNVIGTTNEHSGGGGGNGHEWNGATISALCRVAEGDYVQLRMAASNGATSGTRGYLYGHGSASYQKWSGWYIAGAQRDDPQT